MASSSWHHISYLSCQFFYRLYKDFFRFPSGTKYGLVFASFLNEVSKTESKYGKKFVKSKLFDSFACLLKRSQTKLTKSARSF